MMDANKLDWCKTEHVAMGTALGMKDPKMPPRVEKRQTQGVTLISELATRLDDLHSACSILASTLNESLMPPKLDPEIGMDPKGSDSMYSSRSITIRGFISKVDEIIECLECLIQRYDQ